MKSAKGPSFTRTVSPISCSRRARRCLVGAFDRLIVRPAGCSPPRGATSGVGLVPGPTNPVTPGVWRITDQESSSRSAAAQQVAGEDLFLDGDLLAALELDDVLHRDDHLVDAVLHVHRGDPALEVRLHLVLVAGVGVHDEPAARAVVGARRHDRGGARRRGAPRRSIVPRPPPPSSGASSSVGRRPPRPRRRRAPTSARSGRRCQFVIVICHWLRGTGRRNSSLRAQDLKRKSTPFANTKFKPKINSVSNTSVVEHHRRVVHDLGSLRPQDLRELDPDLSQVLARSDGQASGVSASGRSGRRAAGGRRGAARGGRAVRPELSLALQHVALVCRFTDVPSGQR